MKTLTAVVEQINSIYAPEGEMAAARYAVEAAQEAGYPDLEVHLDVLCDAGASFIYEEALGLAARLQQL